MNSRTFNLVFFSFVYVSWALVAIIVVLDLTFFGNIIDNDFYISSILFIILSLVIIYSLIRLFKNDVIPAIIIAVLLGFNLDFEQLKFINILLIHGEIAYNSNGNIEFIFLLFGGPDITVNTKMEIISFNKIGYNLVSLFQVVTLLMQKEDYR